MSDTDGSVAPMARTGVRGGVLRGHDEATVQPGCDGRVADGLEALSRQPRSNGIELHNGYVLCDECFGDPSQYLSDFEEICPCCGGRGFLEDPDYVDESESFDPRREWGTYRVIRGRVA